MNISTEQSTVPMVRPAGTSPIGAPTEPSGVVDVGTAAVLDSGRLFFSGAGPLIGTLFSAPAPATRHPKDMQE